MASDWVFEIDNRLFTVIKTRCTKALKTKYPSINFTNTTNDASKKADFPSVYMKLLPGYETARTTEAQEVNSVNLTYQIDVYTNTSQSDANEVMATVFNEMKRLCFNGSSIPAFENMGVVYRDTARFNRVFSSNDKF